MRAFVFDYLRLTTSVPVLDDGPADASRSGLMRHCGQAAAATGWTKGQLGSARIDGFVRADGCRLPARAIP